MYPTSCQILLSLVPYCIGNITADPKAALTILKKATDQKKNLSNLVVINTQHLS